MERRRSSPSVTRFGQSSSRAASIHEWSIILHHEFVDQVSLYLYLYSQCNFKTSGILLNSSQLINEWVLISFCISLLLFCKTQSIDFLSVRPYASVTSQHGHSSIWCYLDNKYLTITICVFHSCMLSFPSLHWFIQSVPNGWKIRWQRSPAFQMPTYFLFHLVVFSLYF